MKTYTKRALSWLLAVALLITCGISGLVLPATAEQPAPTDAWTYANDFEGDVSEWSFATGVTGPAAESAEIANKVVTIPADSQAAIKASFTINQKLEAGKQYLFRVMAKKAGSDSGMLYFQPPTGSNNSFTISKDYWMGFQYLYVCTEDDTDGFTVNFGAQNGAVMIDKVEAYEVHSDLNLAFHGDMNERAYWFNEYYTKETFEFKTEGDNTYMYFTNSIYPNMSGVNAGGVYEISFDYKATSALNLYWANGAVRKNVGSTAASPDAWATFKAYVDITGTANKKHFLLRSGTMSEGFCLDNFKVRRVEVAFEDVDVVNIGKTATLSTGLLPAEATGAVTPVWTSSDETVATVDANGVVTGLKKGDVTISATISKASQNATVFSRDIKVREEGWVDPWSYETGFEGDVSDWTFAGEVTGPTADPDNAENKIVEVPGDKQASLMTKVKINQKLEAGKQYLFRFMAKKTTDGDANLYMILPQKNSPYVTVKVGDWVGYQFLYKCSADAADGFEVAIAAQNGSFVVDDFAAYEVHPELNLAFHGDMNARSHWFYTFYTRTGFEFKTEGDNTYMYNIGGAYICPTRNGVSSGSVYEVTMDYKCASDLDLFYATCSELQSVGSKLASTGDEWATYKVYLNWTSNNESAIMFRPVDREAPLLIDNLVVRRLEMDVDADVKELDAGFTTTLKTKLQPADAALTVLPTWTSSDETIATVDENGVVKGVKEGTATITATIGKMTASYDIKINATEPLTGVTLDKTEINPFVDEKVTLTPAPVPSTVALPELVWTSSDETVATVANGEVTALKAGTTTITVKAGDFTATCAVTVKERPVATGLALSKTTLKLQEGDVIALTASVVPADAPMPTITWESSDPTIATVANGEVTGVKAGTVTISAKADGLPAATCAVTVEADDGNLIVNGDFEQAATIGWGGSENIVAGAGKDGSNGIKMTSTCTDSTVIITTLYKEDVIALLEPSTVYELSFDTKHVGKGASQLYLLNTLGTLTAETSPNYTWEKEVAFMGSWDAILNDTDWTTVTYTFKTPATPLATSKGLELRFRSIQYYFPGTLVDDGYAETYVDNVKLIKKGTLPATAITLGKSEATLEIGAQQKLTLGIVPEGAEAKNIKWTSSNEAVATVDANGLVTAVALGEATITVSADGLPSVTCKVTVVADDGNLFENGDFEQGKDVNWGGKDSVVDGVGLGGSVGFKGATTYNASANQEVRIYYKGDLLSLMEPDTIYELSFDVKHEGKGFAQIYFNKSFGTQTNGKGMSDGISVVSGDKDWQNVTYTFQTASEMPTAATGFEFMIGQMHYLSAGNEGTGAAYFDNFKLIKKGKVQHAESIKFSSEQIEILPNGTNTAVAVPVPFGSSLGKVTYTIGDSNIATIDAATGKITALVAEGETTVTATNDKGKSCTVKVVISEFANIIQNGDFEQGPDVNWGGSSSVTNDSGRDGGWGAQMLNPTTGKATAVYYKGNISAVTPNTKYIMTIDYFKTKGSSFRIWSGTLDLGIGDFKFNTTGEWATASCIFTAPASLAPDTGWDIGIVSDTQGDEAPSFVDNLTLRKYSTGVDAEAIILDKTSVTMLPGRTASLTPTPSPLDGDLNDMVWTSSDENVVTVEYGKLMGVGKGEATITATTKNGKTATCSVTVSGDPAYILNGTFDAADSKPWILSEGATIVEGEGRIGSKAAQLQKGATLTYNLTGLKPDTEYQFALKARAVGGKLSIKIASGETVLLEESLAKSKSWADKTYTFKTPAEIGADAVLTIAPEADGPVYVDTVRFNVKASLIDFVVNDFFWMGGGTQVTPGTELQFGFTVTNQGSDAAKAGSVLQVELRKNGKAFMTIEKELTDGLSTNESVICVSDQTWKAEEGHWVISAAANPKLTILESIDNNNTTQKNLRVDDEILTAPQVALDAEMTDLTFSDEFDSLETIDQLATGDDGYKWYVTRQWSATTITPDCYSINDGILTLHSTQPGYHVTLATQDVNTGNGYTWNKGYLEARFRIPNADPGEDGKDYDGSPAIWSFPDTKWLEIKGKNHQWVEMDWLEYWGVTKDRPGGYYTITFHDQHTQKDDQDYYWYSNSNAFKEGLGDEQWHTMGWLWAENVVITYVDGVEVQRITFSRDDLPSCQLNMHDSKDMDATGAFTYMNEQFNALFISSGKDFPMEMDYVRIWQGGSGVIDLPSSDDKPAVDVDAKDFWYYYCTDDYGDNIVEINEENYSIVLGGQDLWAQLSDERKAEINALLTANGQPTFDKLLEAAIAFEKGDVVGGDDGEDSPETGATTVLPVALAAVMLLSGAVLVKSRKRREEA